MSQSIGLSVWICVSRYEKSRFEELARLERGTCNQSRNQELSGGKFWCSGVVESSCCKFVLLAHEKSTQVAYHFDMGANNGFALSMKTVGRVARS